MRLYIGTHSIKKRQVHKLKRRWRSKLAVLKLKLRLWFKINF